VARERAPLALRVPLGRHLVRFADGQVWITVGERAGLVTVERPTRAASAAPAVEAAAAPRTVVQVGDDNARAPEVRRCYEAGIARRPDLGGQLALALSIDDQGRVKQATVARSTLGSPAVEACVVEAARRWTFIVGAEREETLNIILRPGDP
jgi:TonB family protein